MNETANATLALGALPVMAHARRGGRGDGRPRGRARAQHRHALAALGRGDAARRAAPRTQRGVPVVLDPVGAGATRYRTETAKRILDEVDVTVLRGNAGEVATLVGVGGRGARRRVDRRRRRSGRARPRGGALARRRRVGHRARSTTSPTGRACSRSRTAIRCSRRSPARAACRARSPAASSPSPGRRSTRAVEALVAFGVAGEDAARRREGPGLVPRRALRRARRARSRHARRAGEGRVRVHAIVARPRDGAARGRGGRDGRAAAREGADGRGRRARPRASASLGATFVVNDDVDAALELGADGVHLGQSDPGAERARAGGLLLGRSAVTFEQAVEADADYLGVGPIWETPSKDDADPALGLDELARICARRLGAGGRDRRHRRVERGRLHPRGRGRRRGHPRRDGPGAAAGGR